MTMPGFIRRLIDAATRRDTAEPAGRLAPRRIRAAVLAWQLVATLLPTTALCVMDAATSQEFVLCTCDGMEDGSCPMKHAPAAASTQHDGSDRPQWCTGCGNPAAGFAALMRTDAPPEEPWRILHPCKRDASLASYAASVGGPGRSATTPPPKA